MSQAYTYIEYKLYIHMYILKIIDFQTYLIYTSFEL